MNSERTITILSKNACIVISAVFHEGAILRQKPVSLNPCLEFDPCFSMDHRDGGETFCPLHCR